MDEATARALRRELEDILRTSGFGWIVDQVDETVREGIYVVARVARRGKPRIEETVERPSDAQRGEGALRPYRDEEVLQLLVVALRRSVLDAARLEDDVADHLLESDQTTYWPGEAPPRRSLEFYDEQTSRVRRALSQDRDRVVRTSTANELSELLDEFARVNEILDERHDT